MSTFGFPGGPKLVLGLIHLHPLPGTPFHVDGSFADNLRTAVRSALALAEGGADGCLIQTVDRVYSTDEHTDPARVAAMAILVREVAEATGPGFRVGAQMMRNAVQASLAVAKVGGGSYVRASTLVGATLTAHGMVTADPLGVMDYRRKIDAWDVGIVADINSMHFSWFGNGKTTAEVSRYAKQVGADAVSLCHPETDTALQLIESVREATPDMPVILAGNTNHRNAARLMRAADGAFVGSCLEQDGWGGEIDGDLVKSYVDIVREAEK
jgi:membrane complex biogenesis BtpA family protein